MTDRINRNEGVVNNGGTVNVGTFAVGRGASAISNDVAGPVSRKAAPPPVTHAPPYVAQSSPIDEYDAFVSHATEDKDFVEPLIDALVSRGLKIWYDTAVMRVGNSVRESIDLGLVSSKYIIVVLSRYYFSKDWTRREVNGMFTREVDGHRVVLPIWHNVTAAEVARFSPMLADRLAVQSSDGTEKIVERIIDSMGEHR